MLNFPEDEYDISLRGIETNQEKRMAGLEAPCWTWGSKYHLISKRLWPREPNKVFVARGYIPCSLRSQDHFKDPYSVWWAAAGKVKSPCVPTIHKPVSAQQEGTVQNGVAVIPEKGETGSGGEGTGSECVSLGTLSESVSIPHPDWPRQTESGTGGEAAIREQLNHRSLPASQQIVTARVTPGPVVSCCPPHSLGFRWLMAHGVPNLTSHLRLSPTCTQPPPFPLLSPFEKFNERIKDDPDVSGPLCMAHQPVKSSVYQHANTKPVIGSCQLLQVLAAVPNSASRWERGEETDIY